MKVRPCFPSSDPLGLLSSSLVRITRWILSEISKRRARDDPTEPHPRHVPRLDKTASTQKTLHLADKDVLRINFAITGSEKGPVASTHHST